MTQTAFPAERELDARILAHAVAAQCATPGALARRLKVEPKAIAGRVRSLIAGGALDLSSTTCHTQLAVQPGSPDAIAPLIHHDPSGVLEGWVTIRQARLGQGSQPLCSLSELSIVARRYCSRARCALFLMPEPEAGASPILTSVAAICRDLARHQVKVGLLVPRAALGRTQTQPLLDAIAGTGAALRTSSRVDTPLLLWGGLGVVHLVHPELRLQMNDVRPAETTARACYEAADPVHKACPAEVIRLLASGMTDAAAARHMGISERQFRRYVSQLMDELDASSRFQAGIEAARYMQWD